MLNNHYRSQSFQVFSDSKVAGAFRENIGNGFDKFVGQYQKTPLSSVQGKIEFGGNGQKPIEISELISLAEVGISEIGE